MTIFSAVITSNGIAKSFLVVLALGLLACGNEAEQKDVSTVDPAIMEPLDSIPLDMHLDSLNDTVTLDSMGRTINPEDTNYRRK